MPHINIEIKAKCADQEKVRGILKAHGADFKGTDHQIDTYFKIPQGRLKLREGNIENSLIFYEREDKAGPKQSNIILFNTESGSSLKAILEKSVGELAVVDKQREIYFIDNVKFHVDTVKGLGTFVEIEAIDTDGSIGKEKLLEQCNMYLKLFEINESDLLNNSYSDQVMKLSAQ
jgi:predicted adenylyl cyclase CyaB